MINLTIQSLNNKSIQAINLETNVIQSTFNQSQEIALNYSNIFLKIQTGDTFTMSNVAKVVNKVPDNYVYFFIAVGLIICTIVLINMVKK